MPGIVDALDDRLSMLSGGRRRAVDRHGTMRATLDWSYRLLDVDEQRLLQRLAVFPNGFELDAVEHVASALGIDAPGAAEHLASLVHKSMVAAEPFGEGSAAVVRYRMLQTTRAFALERLNERGERPAAVLALAGWVASIIEGSVVVRLDDRPIARLGPGDVVGEVALLDGVPAPPASSPRPTSVPWSAPPTSSRCCSPTRPP